MNEKRELSEVEKWVNQSQLQEKENAKLKAELEKEKSETDDLVYRLNTKFDETLSILELKKEIERLTDMLFDEENTLEENLNAENSKLKAEIKGSEEIRQVNKDHWEKERAYFKKSLSEAKAEALEEHNIARQNNIDFHNECADYNKLKQEKVNLDKALDNTCLNLLSINHDRENIDDLDLVNCKNKYLKEARGGLNEQ